jgi:integrase
MADERKLERTATPGIYRRHAGGCKRTGRCKCSYVVTWKQGGAQHRQMFGSYELAREFKGGLSSGKTSRRPLSSKTLADYYETWLPSFRGRTSRGLDDSTRDTYEASFRLHVLPLPIARLRMRDLASPDVRDWLRELERHGVSPWAIRNARAALSVMLATAAEDGDLGSNPAAGVRYVPSERAKRAHPKRRRRALTPEDVKAMLTAMDEDWRAFFMLLVQTGVRVGEALGLTWGNVHLADDAHIMVVEQVRHGKRKRLKTEASFARVPLSPTMAAWLTVLRPEGVAANAPVFASKTGTPLNYSNVYHRVLQPALKEVGLDGQGIAFHAFRKACGSFLLHHGKTLKQVQGWLRHSQLTTTLNVYIQQVDDGLGGAAVWDDILDAPCSRHDSPCPPPTQPGAIGRPRIAGHPNSMQ